MTVLFKYYSYTIQNGETYFAVHATPSTTPLRLVHV